MGSVLSYGEDIKPPCMAQARFVWQCQHAPTRTRNLIRETKN